MGQMSVKVISKNPKAYHDYFIDDKYEAGIELFGTEVKSIRMGKCSIKAVSYTHLGEGKQGQKVTDKK